MTDTGPASRNALERVSRRDRVWIGLALAAIAVVAWSYLIHLAAGMGAGSMDPTGMAMPQTRPWTPMALLLLFIMWVVMMVAMMLPSAAPMILLFGSITRRRRAERRPYAPTAVFVAGYLLVWSGYSALATLAQWGLHSAALLPGMASSSTLFGGTVLVAAGVFQWTPLKDTCLRACRSPLGWITAEWREGRTGALIMGIRHGAFCVGCCWALMALLFVAGVMNLLWVAALTAFVLVEKVGPAGEWVARTAGLLLVGSGAWLLVGAAG